MLKQIFLFAILFISQTAFADQVYISLIVDDAKDKTVQVEVPINGTYLPNNQKTFKLDKGLCDITVDLDKAGFIYVSNGSHTVQLFAKPGGNYGISFKRNKFDQSLKVGGDDALAQQVINKAINVNNFKSMLVRQQSADGIIETTDQIRSSYDTMLENLSLSREAKTMMKYDIDYFINYQTNKYFIELREKVGESAFKSDFQTAWNTLNDKVKIQSQSAAASKWYHMLLKQYVGIYKQEEIAQLNETSGLQSKDFAQGKHVPNILKALNQDFKNGQFEYVSAALLAEYIEKYSQSETVMTAVQNFVKAHPSSPYAAYLKVKMEG